MKIRIKGNSIRLRLTRSEVESFSNLGIVAETTVFFNSTFHYVLRKADQNQMTSTFEYNCITVYMPTTWAQEWVETERVGYDSKMPLNDGLHLTILVEKDFVCLDDTTEDQSDNYPNPLKDSHK